jgi:hypothetical protein
MILPGTWLVCFYDPVTPSWHARFARKGFGHCNVAGFIPEIEKWMIADWSAQGLATYLLESEAMTPIFAALSLHGKVLAVDVPRRRPKFLPVPRIFYCVPLVKQVIGLRSGALTPYGLFCVLRARGARPMFELAASNGV